MYWGTEISNLLAALQFTPAPRYLDAPVKELTYFNIEARTPIILHTGRDSQSGSRARVGRWSLKTDRLWALRYLLFYRTDSWYQSLFAPAKGRVCGDMTPDYSILSDEKIAHVNSFAFGLKPKCGQINAYNGPKKLDSQKVKNKVLANHAKTI